MQTYTYTSIKAFSNISANFRLYKNKIAYENRRILKQLRRCQKKNQKVALKNE
jgi:hypothetical protein